MLVLAEWNHITWNWWSKKKKEFTITDILHLVELKLISELCWATFTVLSCWVRQTSCECSDHTPSVSSLLPADLVPGTVSHHSTTGHQSLSWCQHSQDVLKNCKIINLFPAIWKLLVSSSHWSQPTHLHIPHQFGSPQSSVNTNDESQCLVLVLSL